MKRTILFAPNVGVGGGLVLLRAILNAWPSGKPLLAILDERGREEVETDCPSLAVHWFKSSLSGRWKAERLLQQISTANDTVLCFHNLPPVLPNPGKVLCYVHGPHIVNLVDTSKLNTWVRTRSAVERLIFRSFKHRIGKFFVQTPTMQSALAKTWGTDPQQIALFPFVDPERLPPARLPCDRAATELQAAERHYSFDFLYVSDGATHKNHPVLFKAWELLAEQGMFPSLALTLHPVRDRLLRELVDRLVEEKNLRIEDLGQMPHEKILKTYASARALLFASYAETFGIPLIEAKAAGLPILAAEMDFVRDVCTPIQTFDPHSPRSIARAVCRFLTGSAQPIGLRTPAELVVELIDFAADAHHNAATPKNTIQKTDRTS